MIKSRQELDKFYLVYWALANIAWTCLDEGQTRKALKISLALNPCSVEFKRIHDEIVHLLADLQAVLPEEEFETAIKHMQGEIPADQAKARVLALAQEFEYE